MFDVYEYSELEDKYVLKTSLESQDFISYEYQKKDFENVSEFKAKLKGKSANGTVPRYDNLFANNESELSNLKPIIITRSVEKNGDFVIAWFVYIITRLKIRNRDESYYELIGADFKFFEENKLINSNKNYPNGSFDPNSLPDDFGKYNATTTLQNHLIHAYRSFLAPYKLTYGRLDTTIVNERKFKGLDDVQINYANSTTKQIQSDITNVFDFKESLYEAFGINLEVREEFDKTTGKVKIIIEEAQELNIDVIRKNNQILSEEIGSTTRNNFVFGYANPNIDTNQFSIGSSDFTSLEVAEDVSFVSKNNITYATNTTKTLLKKELKNRFIREFSITPYGAFTEINAGDIARINDNVFKIKSLTESNSLNGLEYFIEIEEVE